MEGVFIPKKQLTGKECLCVCLCYLHKLLCVLMELFQYWQRLFRKAVFENALDDSAAVGVSGEGEDLRRRIYTLQMSDKRSNDPLKQTITFMDTDHSREACNS